MNNQKELVDFIFKYCVNRIDTFALQTDDGSYTRISRSLEEKDVIEHLEYSKTVAVYQLDKENNIKNIVFDIDSYGAEKKAEIIYDFLAKHFSQSAAALEYTGGRGYHVWLFFENKVPASVGRFIAKKVLEKVQLDCEIFPKQDALSHSTPYGSAVRLPFGFHRKYRQPSRFIKPENVLEIKPFTVPKFLINKITSETQNSLSASTVSANLCSSTLKLKKAAFLR